MKLKNTNFAYDMILISSIIASSMIYIYYEVVTMKQLPYKNMSNISDINSKWPCKLYIEASYITQQCNAITHAKKYSITYLADSLRSKMKII